MDHRKQGAIEKMKQVCPRCLQEYNFAPSQNGQSFSCFECGENFVIGEADPASTPASAPMASQVSAPMASQVSSPAANRSVPPLAKRGASPMANRSVPPLGNRGAAPMANRGASPLANRSIPPLGNRGASPLGNRGAAPGAAPLGNRGASLLGNRGAAPGAAPLGNRGASPFANRSVPPPGNREAAPMAKPLSAPMAKQVSAPMAEQLSAPMAEQVSAPMATPVQDNIAFQKMTAVEDNIGFQESVPVSDSIGFQESAPVEDTIAFQQSGSAQNTAAQKPASGADTIAFQQSAPKARNSAPARPAGAVPMAAPVDIPEKTRRSLPKAVVLSGDTEQDDLSAGQNKKLFISGICLVCLIVALGGVIFFASPKAGKSESQTAEENVQSNSDNKSQAPQTASGGSSSSQEQSASAPASKSQSAAPGERSVPEEKSDVDRNAAGNYDSNAKSDNQNADNSGSSGKNGEIEEVPRITDPVELSRRGLFASALDVKNALNRKNGSWKFAGILNPGDKLKSVEIRYMKIGRGNTMVQTKQPFPVSNDKITGPSELDAVSFEEKALFVFDVQYAGKDLILKEDNKDFALSSKPQIHSLTIAGKDGKDIVIPMTFDEKYSIWPGDKTDGSAKLRWFGFKKRAEVKLAYTTTDIDQTTGLCSGIGQETFFLVDGLKFVFSSSAKNERMGTTYEYLFIDGKICSLKEEIVQLEQKLQHAIKEREEKWKIYNNLSYRSSSSYKSSVLSDYNHWKNQAEVLKKSVQNKRYELKEQEESLLSKLVRVKKATIYRNGQVLKRVNVECHR